MCQDLPNPAAVDSRDLLNQPGSAVHSSFRIQDDDQRVEDVGISDMEEEKTTLLRMRKVKERKLEEDKEIGWRQATMVPFLNQYSKMAHNQKKRLSGQHECKFKRSKQLSQQKAMSSVTRKKLLWTLYQTRHTRQAKPLEARALSSISVVLEEGALGPGQIGGGSQPGDHEADRRASSRQTLAVHVA